jgi:hypothetical protein
MSALDRAVFVLLLESHAAWLYQLSRRFPERRPPEQFSPDAAGQAALAACLRTRFAPAVRLLVNLPEAVELRENIPCLRGGERRAALARKLQQHFGDNPFAMATSLGVETVGLRQEEKLRLVALPAAALRGWIDALGETPLAGIHDVPQVIECLARREANWPSCCLVLTAHHGAVRQTLLSGDTLSVRTSRLLSVPLEGGADWIAQETERLRAYLVRQRLIDADAVLPVYPLAFADRQAELRAAFARTGFDKCLLQAPHPAFSGSGEEWLLSALAKYPPRSQYAPAALRRDYLSPSRRRMALGAGGFLLLAGVALGGADFFKARAIQAQTAVSRLVLEQTQEEYRMKAGLYALPANFDADAARALLMAYDRSVDANSPEWMLTDLRNLSIWLDRYPDIRLEKLRWQAQGRMLFLEGNAPPACVARFARDLAGQGVDSEIQQAAAEAETDESEFMLSIHHGRAR